MTARIVELHTQTPAELEETLLELLSLARRRELHGLALCAFARRGEVLYAFKGSATADLYRTLGALDRAKQHIAAMMDAAHEE